MPAVWRVPADAVCDRMRPGCASPMPRFEANINNRKEHVRMLDKMTKGALVLMAVAAIPAPALAAQPTRSAAMPDVGVAPNTPWAEAPLAILYNQYDNSGAVALNSQNFEAAYDAYDDQAADDFFVPANTSWKIVGVGIQGLYFNGP